MVYPTISTSLLAIFNVRCEMDPSRVKSINAVLSNSNLIEMSSGFDRCLAVFGGGNYC